MSSWTAPHLAPLPWTLSEDWIHHFIHQSSSTQIISEFHCQRSALRIFSVFVMAFQCLAQRTIIWQHSPIRAEQNIWRRNNNPRWVALWLFPDWRSFNSPLNTQKQSLVLICHQYRKKHSQFSSKHFKITRIEWLSSQRGLMSLWISNFIRKLFSCLGFLVRWRRLWEMLWVQRGWIACWYEQHKWILQGITPIQRCQEQTGCWNEPWGMCDPKRWT